VTPFEMEAATTIVLHALIVPELMLGAGLFAFGWCLGRTWDEF